MIAAANQPSAAELPQAQPAVTVHLARPGESRQGPEPIAPRDTGMHAVVLQPASPRALPLPDFHFAGIDEEAASAAKASIDFAAQQLEVPGGEAAVCQSLLCAISAADGILTPSLRSSTFDAAAIVCIKTLSTGIAVESMIKLLRRISAGTQLPSQQAALWRGQMKCALRYMAAIEWTVQLSHGSPAARDRCAVLKWALEHAAFAPSICKSPVLRFAANADHLFREPERSRFKAAVIRTSLVLDPRGKNRCRVGKEQWTYPQWLVDGRRELSELSEGMQQEQAQAATDMPHKRKREEPPAAEPMSADEWEKFKRELDEAAWSVY